jgi:hypothetical protein
MRIEFERPLVDLQRKKVDFFMVVDIKHYNCIARLHEPWLTRGYNLNHRSNSIVCEMAPVADAVFRSHHRLQRLIRPNPCFLHSRVV